MRRSKSNSTYFGTEQRLLHAAAKVLKEKHALGVKTREISREAGLANSSFYIHYKSLSDLIDKNEAKILDAIDHVIDREQKVGSSTETILRNILFVLRKHQDVLDIVIGSENLSLPLKAMAKLRPLITRSWNSYGEKADDAIYRLVEFQFMAEVSIWKSEDFSIDTLSKHASHLAFFSANAPRLFIQIYYK
ncbi:TetR/AcrR family transcriptional regulator [Candidatus Saccharibacteria bacterium]|nr:TetR/AcrR family transcriptional regulator [Candidatus Saccharibacteria bacterium]